MRNGIKMNNTLFMDFFAVETSDDGYRKEDNNQKQREIVGIHFAL
jgi:hypothetical protein